MQRGVNLMDHIYIYYVNGYDKTVEFEIHGFYSFEGVFADILSFNEFKTFLKEYKRDVGEYTINIDEEDRETLIDYFGYDILR